MSSIFTSKPGVVRVLQHGGSPGYLLQTSPTITNSAPKPVIITSFGYSQDVNIQFMPTLRKMIYVYAFGDRMGTVTIGGVAFNDVCSGDSPLGNSGLGTVELLKYYDANKAVKDGQTVSVSIGNGSNTVTGFLTSMTLQAQDPEYMSMDFSMEIAVISRSQGKTV